MKSHVYTFSHHFSFSKTEIHQISITALFAALLLSMRYGAESLRVSYGLVATFILYLLSTVLFILLGVIVQKYVGIALGYKVSYAFFPSGLGIGLITFLLSATTIPLFFPGYLRFDRISHLRLGKFRQGMKNWEMALIGVAGPLTSMLMILLIAPFHVTNSYELVFMELVFVNLCIMIFSLIPIPVFHVLKLTKTPHVNLSTIEEGTIGFSLLYVSRTAYVLVLSVFLLFFALILFDGLFNYSLALLIGVVIAYLYKRFYEGS